MNPLFSKSSLMILESLSFTKTLYAFDFDGTLSKIVQVPSQATILKKTNELLKQLSEMVPVAIISGRSIEDLKCRLKFKPPYLIGNHGLEGLDENRFSLNEASKRCKSWNSKLSDVQFISGVQIEDKTYSLAIHFRHCRKKKEAKAQILSAIADLSPSPRVIFGKSVINILPPMAPHKGIAVLELMLKVGAKNAFYIGDDDTDEDVFGLPNSQIMSVRVGEKKTSQARYFIERQSQINELLRLLIKFHSQKSAFT